MRRIPCETMIVSTKYVRITLEQRAFLTLLEEYPVLPKFLDSNAPFLNCLSNLTFDYNNRLKVQETSKS